MLLLKTYEAIYEEMDDNGLEDTILHNNISIKDEELKDKIKRYIEANFALRDFIILKMTEETCENIRKYCGVEQLAAREPHKLKIAGSTPASALFVSSILCTYQFRCPYREENK